LKGARDTVAEAGLEFAKVDEGAGAAIEKNLNSFNEDWWGMLITFGSLLDDVMAAAARESSREISDVALRHAETIRNVFAIYFLKIFPECFIVFLS